MEQVNNLTTYIENADIKVLIKQFAKLKNEINNSYSAEFNEFSDSTAVIFANSILQELHNRICKHFNIKPTTVTLKPYDFYLNESSQGFYSFESKEITNGLLVNFKKENCETFFYNYLGDSWCEFHLINLFHETYHHIQMDILEKYLLKQPIPKEFENEIKMLNIFFKNASLNNLFEEINPIQHYFLNPIELPARRFAFNAFEYLINNNIIEKSEHINTYKNFLTVAEMDCVGNNLVNLKNTMCFWQNVSNNEKVVKNFYEDMINYFADFSENGNIIIKQIETKLCLDKVMGKHNLKPVEILALNYDYEKYLTQEDKKEFLNKVKKSNYVSKLYASNKYYSNLPQYVLNLKNLETEKETQ